MTTCVLGCCVHVMTTEATRCQIPGTRVTDVSHGVDARSGRSPVLEEQPVFFLVRYSSSPLINNHKDYFDCPKEWFRRTERLWDLWGSIFLLDGTKEHALYSAPRNAQSIEKPFPVTRPWILWEKEVIYSSVHAWLRYRGFLTRILFSYASFIVFIILLKICL